MFNYRLSYQNIRMMFYLHIYLYHFHSGLDGE